jgi:hypothetical protein
VWMGARNFVAETFDAAVTVFVTELVR